MFKLLLTTSRPLVAAFSNRIRFRLEITGMLRDKVVLMPYLYLSSDFLKAKEHETSISD